MILYLCFITNTKAANMKVAKHLTKLFDSMAKLLMEEDGEGKVTNTAHTMVAKDGETVLFKVPD